MNIDPDHPILDRPWEYQLVEIKWRPNQSLEKSYMDLTFRKAEEFKRLRFWGPSNLRIQEGYMGDTGGMVIRDISAKGWDRKTVEVANFEGDPDMTFVAHKVELISDNEGA